MGKSFVAGLIIAAIGVGVFWSPIVFEVDQHEAGVTGLAIMCVGAMFCYYGMFNEWRKERGMR